MNELKSEGLCVFCKELFEQKAINRHLKTHLTQKAKEDVGKKTKNYCHITIGDEIMFLHLLVAGESAMRVIDNFLRRIWLDCCGHMSKFDNVNKEDLVQDVMTPRAQVPYIYDFGSSTSLLLEGCGHYKLSIDEEIVLLSRNEPLKLLCTTCGKTPAVSICSVCMWEQEAFFCEKCGKAHAKTCEDFDDYANMPAVNSPRMGTCGYEGGLIDLERDGPYKAEK